MKVYGASLIVALTSFLSCSSGQRIGPVQQWSGQGPHRAFGSFAEAMVANGWVYVPTSNKGLLVCANH